MFKVVMRMCARLWEFLESEHGIEESRPGRVADLQVHGPQAATRAGAFYSMSSVVVGDALDALLGAWRPATWPHPMVGRPPTRFWVSRRRRGRIGR